MNFFEFDEMITEMNWRRAAMTGLAALGTSLGGMAQGANYNVSGSDVYHGTERTGMATTTQHQTLQHSPKDTRLVDANTEVKEISKVLQVGGKPHRMDQDTLIEITKVSKAIDAGPKIKVHGIEEFDVVVEISGHKPPRPM